MPTFYKKKYLSPEKVWIFVTRYNPRDPLLTAGPKAHGVWRVVSRSKVPPQWSDILWEQHIQWMCLWVKIPNVRDHMTCLLETWTKIVMKWWIHSDVCFSRDWAEAEEDLLCVKLLLFEDLIGGPNGWESSTPSRFKTLLCYRKRWTQIQFVVFRFVWEFWTCACLYQ